MSKHTYVSLSDEAMFKLAESFKVSIDASLNDAESSKISESQKQYTSGITQWSNVANAFIPTGDTIKEIPSGVYTIGYIGDRLALKKRELVAEKLLKLPYEVFNEVIKDIEDFKKAEERYTQFGVTYRRGILLFGHPGGGKSCLIELLCLDFIKNGAIIVYLTEPDAIYSYEPMMTMIRDIEPNRQIIVVMEDLNNFTNYSNSVMSKLLNILDGYMKINNIVYLATTNYLDQLPPALINRPSRFNRKFEIGFPDEKVRKFYFESKLKPVGVPASDIERMVEITKGFTFDLMKELIISIYVLQMPEKEVLEILTNQFGNWKNNKFIS